MFFGLNFLDEKALENIKKYRYTTHGLTPLETAFYDKWWTFCANLLPPVIYLEIYLYSGWHQTS